MFVVHISAVATAMRVATAATLCLHGVGVDLAHIPRFAVLLHDAQRARRLLSKALHPAEIDALHRMRTDGQSQRAQAQFVASRWAVKEAVTKAFGSRLLFPEMRVVRDSDGQDPRPRLSFDGACGQRMAAAGIRAADCLLSLSHEVDYAAAVVVLQTTRPRQAEAHSDIGDAFKPPQPSTAATGEA